MENLGYADGLAEYKEILEFEFEDDDEDEEINIENEIEDDDQTAISEENDEQVLPIEEEDEPVVAVNNDIEEVPIDDTEDYTEEIELGDENERENNDLLEQGYSLGDNSDTDEESENSEDQEKSQYWETPTEGPRQTRNAAPKYHSYRHQAVQFLMESEAKRRQSERDFGTEKELYKTVVNYLFAQMKEMHEEDCKKAKQAGKPQIPASQGIKIYGERAVAAMMKEFKQLNQGAVPEQNKPVICPVDPSILTDDEKRKAMHAVNLIKEKRDYEIKGRTCADGSKQKRYLKPDETVSSPAVGLDAFFTSLLIDAYENRNVTVFDVPGAFLQPEMPEKDGMVLLKMTGTMVDLMCEVNPEYIPTVIYENGRKVLYMRVLRSLYGCIEAALLWYKLFSTTLTDMGFEINPYDRCVANKTINGKQCTIVWYVDDCKISHVKQKVIDEIIGKQEGLFGKFHGVTRGKKHSYLGMNFELKTDGTVALEMEDDIRQVIEDFRNSRRHNYQYQKRQRLLSCMNLQFVQCIFETFFILCIGLVRPLFQVNESYQSVTDEYTFVFFIIHSC